MKTYCNSIALHEKEIIFDEKEDMCEKG